MPDGEQFQINTTTGGDQLHAAVDADEAGNFVVAFKDNRDLRARRFDAIGLPLGDDFLVKDQYDNRYPDVAVAPDGRFVVVWHAPGGDGDADGVRGRRYDSLGNALGSDFQINTTTTRSQFQPSVAIDAEGRFVVSWTSQTSTQGDDHQTSVHARWFDSDGTPLTDDVQVNTFTLGKQRFSQAAMAADGSSAIVWASTRSDSSDNSTVHIRRFDPNGNPLGDQIQANTDLDETATRPEVAMADDGSFVVVWQDGNASTAHDLPLHIDARFFDSAGVPVGNQFQVDNSTERMQMDPAVAAKTGGRFWVTWSAFDATTDESFVSYRELLNGQPIGSELLVGPVDDIAVRPDVTSIGDGDPLFVWEDRTSAGDDSSGKSVQGKHIGARALIGDKVFLDLDFDGRQDPGEPGVPGVNVELRGPLGDLVESTTTDSLGRYSFRHEPGNGLSYFLAFEAPAGQAFTAADLGDNDSIDSDVDPATGETSTFELASATERRLDLDAGLIPDTAVIGDRVWLDLDADGFQDLEEDGVVGVVVRLLGAGGQVVDETLTDGEGLFAFAAVPSGTYSVEIDLPDGLRPTAQNQGNEETDSDIDPETARSDEFLYAAGTTLRSVDAGLTTAPVLWQGSFGEEVEGLTGEDDDNEIVELSFLFPFEGFEYTTVFVGTNGCLQLGSLGDDGDLDYDLWYYFDEFYADDDGDGDPEPVLCPFGSDLDLFSGGTIHFNDLGDRGVITWNEVGTHDEETHLSTFQVQLLDDGTIIFAYNGVLDGEDEDLLDSLGQGIVVGITLSDGSFPVPEANPWDFTSDESIRIVGDTAYERWCWDEADSCGEDGDDLGYEGPTNDAFDLDFRNVVFNPVAGGGFLVSDEIEVLEPAVFSDGFESGDLTGWSVVVD